jgi:hypothetical protein
MFERARWWRPSTRERWRSKPSGGPRRSKRRNRALGGSGMVRARKKSGSRAGGDFRVTALPETKENTSPDTSLSASPQTTRLLARMRKRPAN